MSSNLARLAWKMGQPLLPEHFIAQEEALLENVALRFSLLGLPMYGLARLSWNESLLEKGILSLQSMTLLLPSGLLLDIPRNTSATSFNLNLVGQSHVQVWLHYVGEEEEQEGNLTRQIHKLLLSSEEHHIDSRESFPLAEFSKDLEGKWHLSSRFVPPLIQMGTTPFFRQDLDDLQQLLSAFHFQLVRELEAMYLSGETLFNAKQCLQALFRLKRLLENLREEVHLHPYFLYEALKEFYSQFSLYRNLSPQGITEPYRHRKLANCFQEIIQPLTEALKLSRRQNPYQAFRRENGTFLLSPLPKEVREAEEVYLLLQKPMVHSRLSLDNLKVASLERLPVVHQLALQGVVLHKIPRPPFQHPFGPEVEFYLLDKGGEWEYVLRDNSLAFYCTDELKDVQAYLFWRMV